MDFDSLPVDAAVPAAEAAPTSASPVQPQQSAAPSFDDLPDDTAAYTTPGQTIAAGAEAAARGALGPAAPFLERVAGVPKSDILARREQFQENHPVASAATEIGGLGASMLTGLGEAKLLDAAGEGASHLAGLGADSGLARIGSAAVKGAAENALYTAQDEASKAISGDPNATVQNAIVPVGLSALLGGGIGGALGTTGELWKATKASQLGEFLKGISDRTGGIEGQTSPSVAETTFKDAGIDMSPSVAGLSSENPLLREQASTLSQSDSHFARKAKDEIANAYTQAGEGVADSLGRKASDVDREFDKNYHGKNIADSIAEDFSQKTAEPIKQFEDFSNRYANVDLPQSITNKSEELATATNKAQSELDKLTKNAQKAVASGDVASATEHVSAIEQKQAQIKQLQGLANQPGATDAAAEKLAKMAQDESWTQSPSSDTMAAYHRIIKDLPAANTLGGLRAQSITIGDLIGKATDAKDFTLARNLGRMKSVLDDIHGDSLTWAVGKKEGGDALTSLAQAKAGYRAAALIKDDLNSSLGAKGSVSGFPKAVKEMGKMDAETVANRLGGKNDAHVLQTLEEHYPKAAKAVRDMHIAKLLSAAKDGEGINAPKFFNELNKLTKDSPQLKEFIMRGVKQNKLASLEKAVGLLKDSEYNFTKSGPVAAKLLRGSIGNAMGWVTALASHAPAVGYALGKAGDMVQHEGGDAVRYGMLKFMGSNAPISAPGFKAAVDLMHHAIKGDALATKAAGALFKSGVKVMPEHLYPIDNDRKSLDKKLKNAAKDPTALNTVGNDTAHYMPDHGTAMAQTAATTTQYLNSIRPQPPKAAPLDSDAMISPDHKAAFNNALNIAHNPLILMDKIKQGTLTPQDMQHATAMYPQWVQSQQAKVTKALMEQVSKGETVPYKIRIGVSLFTNQPLDSTLTQLGIESAQPIPQAAAPPSTQTASKKSVTSKGASALQKAPQQYRTASQAAEQDRGDRS